MKKYTGIKYKIFLCKFIIKNKKKYTGMKYVQDTLRGVGCTINSRSGTAVNRGEAKPMPQGLHQ